MTEFEKELRRRVQARIDHGRITATAIALQAKCSRASLQEWLADPPRRSPKLDTAVRIAEAAGVEIGFQEGQ